MRESYYFIVCPFELKSMNNSCRIQIQLRTLKELNHVSSSQVSNVQEVQSCPLNWPLTMYDMRTSEDEAAFGKSTVSRNANSTKLQ